MISTALRRWCCGTAALLLSVATAHGAPPGLREVEITSSHDGSAQPARWFSAPTERPAPLLVLLHTWSHDYRQQAFAEESLAECRRRGWALIQPNFRGPNRRPQACASPAAVADVLDAVAYAQRQASIDAKRIYLAGASGGGHMALVMACRAPNVWAGVSSWVPVVDLAAWHGETKAAGREYWKQIEAVCGGPPGASAAVDAEYRARSPLFHLAAAQGTAIDLNVGIHDGHTGSIPVSHSLLAFNALAAANGLAARRFTADEIEFIRRRRRLPKTLLGQVIEPDWTPDAPFTCGGRPARPA